MPEETARGRYAINIDLMIKLKNIKMFNVFICLAQQGIFLHSKPQRHNTIPKISTAGNINRSDKPPASIILSSHSWDKVSLMSSFGIAFSSIESLTFAIIA